MLLRLILLTCCCAWLAKAHIHSQKVRHIEPDRVTLSTWMYALASSLLVGACGVFPLIVNRWVRLDRGSKDSAALKAVLSFAVGGLLGDVFLHLLPEAWNMQQKIEGGAWEGRIGVWVLAGLLTFMMAEKLVKLSEGGEEEKEPSTGTQPTAANHLDLACKGAPKTPNGVSLHMNGVGAHTVQNGFRTMNGVTKCNGACPLRARPLTNGFTKPAVEALPVQDGPEPWWLHKDMSGYLNLLANCTDNFTHGLAIAASYVASPMVGLLTTIAILCHEIPHEIGDFAILLNSGFDLHGAAILQMVTACGGVVGVGVGLTAEHMSNAAEWLLPFTAGGFLYISLVSIVPELLQDSSLRACITQLVGLVTGVVVMAMVTIVEKKSCSHMPMGLELT